MTLPFHHGTEESRLAIPSSSTSPETSTLVIAIDGPAGAGKSTVARRLAERLDIPYLDTGAMYRAVGLLAMQAGLTTPFDEAAEVEVGALVESHTIELANTGDEVRVLIDGEDASEAIRSPECALMASAVSAVSEVRRALVPVQRKMGLANGCVMEGRDIGSVVFPDATLKVFLTAGPEERARRRLGDLQGNGNAITLDEVREQQRQRDRQDTSRADSPLHVARGSVVVDSTGLSLDEVIERLLSELGTTSAARLDMNSENTIRSRDPGGLERGKSAPIEEESS